MTKKLFTFKDSWLWGLLLAIATVLCSSVLWLPLRQKLELYHLGTLVGIYSAFWAFVVRRYLDRWEDIRDWNRGYKIGGLGEVSVIFEVKEVKDLFALACIPLDLIRLWSNFLSTPLAYEGQKFRTYNECRDKIADSFVGCSLRVVPEPFLVGGILAGGEMQGDKGRVVGPPGASEERMRNLMRHELSHRALFSLGIPLEQHHKIFAAAGCDF